MADDLDKHDLSWFDALCALMLLTAVAAVGGWAGTLLSWPFLAVGLRTAAFGELVVAALVSVAVVALVVARQGRLAAVLALLSVVVRLGLSVSRATTSDGTDAVLRDAVLTNWSVAVAAVVAMALVLARRGCVDRAFARCSRATLVVAGFAAMLAVFSFELLAGRLIRARSELLVPATLGALTLSAALAPLLVLRRSVAVRRLAVLATGWTLITTLVVTVVRTITSFSVRPPWWATATIDGSAIVLIVVTGLILVRHREAEPAPEDWVEVDGYGQPRPVA